MKETEKHSSIEWSTGHLNELDDEKEKQIREYISHNTGHPSTHLSSIEWSNQNLSDLNEDAEKKIRKYLEKKSEEEQTLISKTSIISINLTLIGVVVFVIISIAGTYAYLTCDEIQQELDHLSKIEGSLQSWKTQENERGPFGEEEQQELSEVQKQIKGLTNRYSTFGCSLF